MGSISIRNLNSKNAAHIMRYGGKRLQVIAKELQVSIATVNRWMKDYDAEKVKEEQRIKNTPLPKPEKIGAVEAKHAKIISDFEKDKKVRDMVWENRLENPEAYELQKTYEASYEFEKLSTAYKRLKK